MGGHHTRDETRYRCRYPSEYSLANDIDHPASVLVREDRIVEALDGWLLQLFEPDRIDETISELIAAAGPSDGTLAAIDAARRQIANCDKRLATYRAALEHGTDPQVVADWIREVQGERLEAEQALVTAQPGRILEADELRSAIAELGDLRPVLAKADPLLKREVYADLGIRMTYRPADNVVEVTADPVGLSACRRGDLNPHAPKGTSPSS
jgi:site-specific DNA recombinase